MSLPPFSFLLDMKFYELEKVCNKVKGYGICNENLELREEKCYYDEFLKV